MARIGGPIYDPTSVAAGVGGTTHLFQSRYRDAGGVSAHPLQRAGIVSNALSFVSGAQGARSRGGLGEPWYPAAAMDMTLPPIIPIAGNPRDPDFMV